MGELKGQWLERCKLLMSVSLGLTFHVYLNMAIAGFNSILSATIFLFVYRAVTMLPYIHVNIFQHIGLPMYTLKDRPAKIYQMATGCLNLNRNIILDWILGHTLVYCHIEHHLFPTLTDSMVLKIRPIVKRFLLEHGLPYNEKSYMNRLKFFVDKYETIMEKAPPITHFVGLP